MRLFVCTAFAFLFACHPPADVGSPKNPIPSTSANQCTAQCAQVGMQLDSIVIMAARVGCVCRAAQAPATAPAAAAAGGMSGVIDDEAAAAAAAQQQSSSSSSTKH